MIEEAAPVMAQEPKAYTRDDLVKMGAKWLERIKDADKRDEQFMLDAEAAEVGYSSDKRNDTKGKVYDFNILHSNIETIVPAIYNSTPIPDIRERFRSGDADPNSAMSRQISQVIERALMVQIDDGAMDTELEDLVQDAQLAGRGCIRVRFDADVNGDMVANERLKYEAVSWRDYREGPARRWQDVPWVAFRQSVSAEQIEKIEDPELKQIMASGAEDKTTATEAPSDTELWEIWCKDTRKVYMVVCGSGEVLTVKDDPLGLPEFFPCPRPVQPLTLTGKRTPINPFAIYKKLAEELEKTTRRISAITDGLKVRGLIVGDAASIEALALAGDNELVPIANLEGLAQTGGLDKAITWWPVEQAVSVLQQLYVARDATKQMIYEVTGISDIVRGQSAASETATAQQIKSEWGSLRIKKMQRQIERCVRELFVISAELISSKFSPDSLQQMTGMQIPEGAFPARLNHYRIDVESDSTVRADLTRKKGEIAGFLEGTAAFFQSMAPVVAQAPEIAGSVTEIYASFARMFQLGKQAEDAIEQMVAGMSQAAEKGVQARDSQMQAQQAEMQAAQASQEQAVQMEGQKLQIEGMKAEGEIGVKNRDVDVKEKELTLKERELMLKEQELMLRAQSETEERGIRKAESEGKQHEAMERVGMERESQRLAAGLPPDFSYEADRDESKAVLAAIANGQNMLLEALGQQTNALTETTQVLINQSTQQAAQSEQATTALALVAQAMTAPKRIVKDNNGRPIGVEVVNG